MIIQRHSAAGKTCGSAGPVSSPPFPPSAKLDSSCSRREFFALGCGGVAVAGLGPLLLPDSQAATTALAAKPTVPLAMWALTGTLPSDGVRRQLDAYNAVGWGIVLYPRWGLEIEYLSDAWFERIRFIVEQAAARHMEVWLYDEFCWPSGHAKGLVTKGREDLEAEILHVEPDGKSRIARIPGSANLLSPDATARFLAVTHDRYAATIGEFFGKTVRAIFTDEPSLAHQHQPRKPGDTSWRCAWSPALDKELGGDFRKRLTGAGDLARSPLWRDYWAAYTRVFHDAWVTPIARWCVAHKIEMSGHLLGEGSFGTQVAYNGSLQRQLGAFGIPGIDEINTRVNPDQCEEMTLAAIAELTGRERMVEVYAYGPSYLRLGTMRKMVDLCAACGVDRYVMAICPFDFRGGIVKREYLGLHSPQQPWFREGARVYAEYLAEAAVRARAAKPLGVPWPSEEELWAAAGPEPLRSEKLRELSQNFIKTARQAILARLEPGVVNPPAPNVGQGLKVDWTFMLKDGNSLRLDQSELTIVDLPETAELSVQVQLVRGLRINGVAINLSSLPADHQFDLSYWRLPVVKYLRAGVNRFEVDSPEPKPMKFLPALILWGGFGVDAQGCLIRPPKTIKVGDWRSQGYPALCGTGCYHAAVNLETVPKYLGVDSGGYPVRVTCNGRSLGYRGWEPFRFDLKSAGRVGRNEIVIEITSTVGHLFVPSAASPVGLLGVWPSNV